MTDRRLLVVAAFLRSVATGMMGPLLGFHLAALAFDARTIGFVISAGLAGAALSTALVTVLGHRVERRHALLVASAFSVGGALVALGGSSRWTLLAAAFVGMLNGMGRDRGAALVVEQAALPDTVPDTERTKAFAWYSVAQDAGTALGALLSGLPSLLRAHAGLAPLAASRSAFLVYVALAALAAAPYFFLSAASASRRASSPFALTARSRRLLARVCRLFAIDAVAGGFLTAAFLALFLTSRFGVDEGTVALLFFGRSVLNAASHVAAAWLARRVGLVNTMVFTHLPSSLLLCTVTIAPSFGVAAALFLLREGLVEMDVPTRTSYVMAVVEPGERGVASGLTQLVRMAGWATGPAIAGLVAASMHSLAAPIWIGAALKITYDLLLYAAFRDVRPPEERHGSTPAASNPA